MSVVEAVQADLAKLPDDLAKSALGELALMLAGELDSQENSATSKSMNARVLLDTLERLRELAPPPAKEKTRFDELAAKRDERLSRKPNSADRVGP